MAAQREEALNTELGRLLGNEPDIGRTVSEKRVSGGKSIDVLVETHSLRIATEAKLAKSSSTVALKRIRSQANRQAAGRVNAGHADLGVAVLYPPATTVENLSGQTLEWNIAPVGPSSVADTVHSGSVSEFTGWMARLSHDPDSGDAVKILLAALDAAAGRLTASERERMITEFGIHIDTSKRRATREKLIRKASVRVLLMVAAAAMFHSRLQTHLSGLPGPHDLQQRSWPPANPTDCHNDPNPVSAFHDAWDQIQLVDYKPIFESACGVLTSMAHTGHRFTEAIRTVTKAAVSIAGTAAAMKQDLLGRLFHKVLDTARYDGSYYTSAASATMLAGLALNTDTTDWSDPDSISKLRICDPACGSGTLLMAAAERIGDLRQVRHGDPDTDYLVGSYLIEDVLWGYDINLAACHLTATTLGLLAPSVEFSRMNIFRTRLGVDWDQNKRATAYLGSLGLLASAGTQLAWQRMTPGEQQQVDDTEQQRAQTPPKMDLVIMNPPFTRDSLRHDQYSRADELEIKKREKELIKGHPNRGAARLHSSDGMFLLLAEHLSKTSQEGGSAVALVLPAVVATSSGALSRRKFLAESFHIEHVVIPHDPQRIAFSENTNISEMLLVARRCADPPPSASTRFVKLLHNPDNPADANLMASRIATARPGAQPSLSNPFIVQEIPADRMAEGDWQAIGFMSTWLYDQWKKLVDGCSRLDDIAKVEPDGRAIRGVYRKSEIATGRQAFWNHKSDRVKTLALKPDTWISAKPPKKKPDASATKEKQPKPSTKKKPSLADRYWGQRSRLLIANRINLPTMRLFAVWSEHPAVGSAFCPVHPILLDAARAPSVDAKKLLPALRDPYLAETEKALAVWFNSTLGLLGVYGSRALKKLPYPSFSLGILRGLPVPKLDNFSRSKLAAAFNEHQHNEVLPFPHVGSPPGTTTTQCPTRKAFDIAVCEALGAYLGDVFGKKRPLEPSYIQVIADALAAEPCLTDERTGLL